MIFLSALVAWLLGKVIRRADDMQTMGMGLVVLYLASPASISFLFHPKNYGRFDAFLIIFTLLSLVIVNKAVLKWLLPLLCLVSMATHEVYLFTYMPIVAISLLHELSRSHFLKKNILLCTVFCVMIVSSFLYFQFFTPHLGFNNAKEMVSYLSLKTDIPINTDMIKSEYFSTISEHWNLYGMFSAEHWLLRLGKGIGCLILLSPLLGIFIFIWKEAIKITADKYSRSILILCLVAPFATLPAFVLALDWGRWFAAIIITQFCLVFYFMYAKNPEILTQLQRVEIYFKRHGYLYLFLIIYLLCLGGFSPETLNILDSVGAISKYFLGLS